VGAAFSLLRRLHYDWTRTGLRAEPLLAPPVLFREQAMRLPLTIHAVSAVSVTRQRSLGEPLSNTESDSREASGG